MRSAQTVFVRSCLLLLLLLGTGGGTTAHSQMGPEFRVNAGTIGNQSNPRVAIDAAGNFLVIWSGDAVAAQRFDREGRRREGEIAIDGTAAWAVDVGMNGAGEFAAAWHGYYGPLNVGRFTPVGTPNGDSLEIVADAYFGAAVETSANGSFVVAWTDYSDFYVTNFTLERFDRRGRSLGSWSPDRGGFDPAMTMSAAGDFILVWGSARQLFGELYDPAGNKVRPTFQVNGTQTGTPIDPAIARARDGSFVVAWEASRQNGAQRDIVARRFDATGAPIGDDFQVNTPASSSVLVGPDVAIAPDRSFVVVWSSSEQDGDQWGVLGRRFDAAGLPIGAEFQVNVFTASHQSSPSIAFDASGAGVVAWHSAEQDGSGFGIYARRIFGAAGGADLDGDGIVNALDNCPTVGNPSQADAGSDGYGDGCVAADVVIHPTAQVGVNPIIGQGSVLGPVVVVGDEARLGEDVRLERQAKVGSRVELGDRVTLGIRAVLGSDVSVGPDTRIDGGASIGEGVTIGDGATIGRNAVVGPRATIGPLALLEIGARIGRGATVEMGARVGRRAVVRPGAVVPAGTTVADGTTFPP